MVNTNPFVSIIVVTYKRPELLLRTLKSIQNQTYTNFECIIVDDSDSSIVDANINELIYQDNRFIYLFRPRHISPGAASCRNYGLLQSKGEYVNWLDDDDLMSPTKIQLQINAIIETQSCLAYCNWKYCNQDDEIIDKDTNYKLNLSYSPASDLIIDYGRYFTFLPHHVFMLKRELLCETGLWNQFLLNNDDGEFFVRVLSKAKKITYVDDAYVLYRLPGQNNLSKLQSEIKARHLVISLIMIQTYLSLIDSVMFSAYFKHNKEHAYYKIKNSGFNHVLDEFKWFFISVRPTPFKRIINKLKQLFN